MMHVIAAQQPQPIIIQQDNQQWLAEVVAHVNAAANEAQKTQLASSYFIDGIAFKPTLTILDLLNNCSTYINLNAFSDTGLTALHTACLWGKIDILELLLARPEVDLEIRVPNNARNPLLRGLNADETAARIGQPVAAELVRTERQKRQAAHAVAQLHI